MDKCLFLRSRLKVLMPHIWVSMTRIGNPKKNKKNKISIWICGMTLSLTFSEDDFNRCRNGFINGNNFPYQMALATLSLALTGDTKEATAGTHQCFLLHPVCVSQVVGVLHGSCRKPKPGSSVRPVFPSMVGGERARRAAACSWELRGL